MYIADLLQPINDLIQPLVDVFDEVLQFFHHNIGIGWGAAIVLLTIVVRLALLPLAIKQYHSMQKMQRVQPEIKKLQARYKGDRERLNQEMMKFYRENKVNPFGSCLPILFQIPVFMALFFLLRKDLLYEICPGVNPPGDMTTKPCGPVPDAHFLFIDDITAPATGFVLVVLLALYVGSQLGSSLLATTSTDKTQRRIILLLPFFFVVFVWQFPAGLLVYWITTNLWTIGQQMVLKRLVVSHTPDVSPDVVSGQVVATRAKKEKGATGNDKAKAAVESKVGPSDSKKVKAASSDDSQSSSIPPSSPRKKRKRSGRRR